MFSAPELKRIEKALAPIFEKNRIARKKHDISVEYRLYRNDVILFERRPQWDDSSKETITEIAKFKRYRSGDWQLFWMRSNGKWHRYDPLVYSVYLGKLAREVLEDPYGCFWG